MRKPKLTYNFVEVRKDVDDTWLEVTYRITNEYNETIREFAEAEARRQRMLAESGPQTIEYMKATAQVTIANAIAAGKVNTIIVPHNMTMLGSVSNK